MSEQNETGSARLRCRDIMTKNPISAHRAMTLVEVARLMRDGDFGILPVVEK